MKKKNQPPKCPYCNKLCNPAGTPLVGSNLMYWACFRCDYRVEDVEYEELKQTKIIEPL
jgi:C4-type Zn-finger protein